MENNLEKNVPYGPIDLDGGSKINTLKIEVKHVNGAMKVDFTPCEVKDGCYTVHYDGKKEHQGFYITLYQGRKSSKKLETMANALWPYTDRIVELFSKGEYESIVRIVKGIANDLNIK